MQVIQVDVSDLQTLQARLARFAHVLGAAVDGARGGIAGVTQEAELGGEEHPFAPAVQGTADKCLVGIGPVSVRGVPERDPQLERATQRGERLGVIVRAVELAHAHAAQTECRDLGTLGAEGAGLHTDHS